jgi:hypothetical protein
VIGAERQESWAMPNIEKSDKKTTLIFVVNGLEVVLDHLNVSNPLHAARDKALAQSNNTARPAADWQIKDEGGNTLDPSRRIESYGFKPGTKLFLSLAVGAGG